MSFHYSALVEKGCMESTGYLGEAFGFFPWLIRSNQTKLLVSSLAVEMSITWDKYSLLELP